MFGQLKGCVRLGVLQIGEFGGDALVPRRLERLVELDAGDELKPGVYLARQRLQLLDGSGLNAVRHEDAFGVSFLKGFGNCVFTVDKHKGEYSSVSLNRSRLCADVILDLGVWTRIRSKIGATH